MSESNKSERSRKLKCLDCNKIFQLPHGSNSAIHPQRYCADCLEADPLNAVASSDHQSDVGANADDYENLECSRCGKCFKSQAALKYHTNKNVCQKSGATLKKQAVVVLLDEDGDGKQAKAFACSVCKKVMKSRQAHAYHMKMKLCEKASGDQPPPQKKMKPNASEDAGDGRESPTNRLQWCQPKGRRTEKMFQTWTHSSTAPLGIRAMCTSMISEAEVLTNLLRNMWDFSDAVALSTWIAEYLMSYSVDGVQTVNLWPLYPVDLCLDEPEAAIDSFSSLDDRMNAKSGEYSKINVFESAFNCTSRSSTATYDDVVINAAGPVWVTAFAPLSANRDTTATTGQIRIWQRRHFVVGVSRIGYINELYPLPSSVRALMVDGGIGPGYDIPHDLFNPQKHDNILQVWSTTMGGSVGDVSGNPSNVTQLCYCVALNKRGAVFKAEWSPGFFAKDADRSSRSADLHDPVSCLGMLAVVCEDGSCLIMFPPIKVANTTHQAAAGYSVPNVPVLSEESVCRFRLSLDAAITCMSWSPHVHLKLCCGHSDGSISIWLLPSTEQRPKKSTSSTGYAMIELIRPVVRIVDSEATKIRSVSFCPYNVDLILSVGYDTKIKIWKSSKVFKPVVSRQTGSVWSLDALWDPFGNGCYAASAETPTVRFLFISKLLVINTCIYLQVLMCQSGIV